MAVNLAELLALPADERLKLAEALWTSVAPADLALLIAEFVERAERINNALDATIRRLETLDEVLARDRAEAREAVLRAGDAWPFERPPSVQ
ncbi:MAG TPA: hypothetical protein VFO94_19580 [Gammaproteobacteria bacterium]|jgi:hypothetical protein|nr:hypothetical protein [Gammaproteobacteria bacterium]